MRKLLALLLLALAVGLLWAGVFLPVRWLTTSQAQWRDEIRVQLARDRGHAKLLPAVSAQLGGLSRLPVWARFYRVEQGSDGGAVVQRDVAALCAASGLAVQSLVQLPSDAAGESTKYSVRLAANGTAEQFRGFVARMRENERYLRAEHLNVTAPQSQPIDQNAVLTIAFDIAGYALQTNAAAKAKSL
ncbi:MAG: GspMb/PilO family protein [Gammaproteobacteria bacterium]